ATRHGRDQQWRAEPLAEQRGGHVDLGKRQLGERVVHELDLLEQRGLAGVLHLRLLAQVEVRALALTNRLSQRSPRTPRSGPAGRGRRHPTKLLGPPPTATPTGGAWCRGRPDPRPSAIPPPPP